ncbi:hypothetical protein B0H16DRAFT_1739615 [Mycena metata]|uniref:Uncharacterized protein n=1 Tax=Mycena metata TaxID=1033252 RepID=A0AAD7MIL1_9AGAR|nr:hypothetical protein B0H16DRAFT_1739615 [Mycena metata]
MFSSQWERMELILPGRLDNAFSIALFAERIGAPFPALSTLALTMGNSGYVMEDTLWMFQNLPQLRNFRLFNGLDLFYVPIDAAALTSLELQTEISLANCNEIFQDFPNLWHLALGDIDFDLPAAPALGPLPPLQSLVLGLAGSDFLALITLPHLRRLNYSIYSRDDIDTLLAFIGRSACALTHLTLCVHLLLEDFFLLQCLQVLPTLEDLCIEYQYSDTRTLCNHLQSLDIVPHLHSFLFRNWNWEPFGIPTPHSFGCYRPGGVCVPRPGASRVYHPSTSGLHPHERCCRTDRTQKNSAVWSRVDSASAFMVEDWNSQRVNISVCPTVHFPYLTPAKFRLCAEEQLDFPYPHPNS